MAIEIHEPDDPLPEPDSEKYFSTPTLKYFHDPIATLARERGRNLFFETEDGRIKKIGITKVRQVISMDDREVRLSNSHARHQLGSTVNNLVAGKWYTLAIDPGTNVILRADEVAPLAVQKEQEYPLSHFELDPWSLPLVSQIQAESFFARVRRQPHIPFEYVQNGCWARAHEMCRLIEHHFDANQKEETVAKIWNIGTLTVRSENAPGGQTSWGYHGAPVVRAEKELLVIDPALFEQPVSVDCWLRKQSDAPQNPLFTSWHAYNFFITGQSFVVVDQATAGAKLQYYWGELIASIANYGPLPYPGLQS